MRRSIYPPFKRWGTTKDARKTPPSSLFFLRYQESYCWLGKSERSALLSLRSCFGLREGSACELFNPTPPLLSLLLFFQHRGRPLRLRRAEAFSGEITLFRLFAYSVDQGRRKHSTFSASRESFFKPAAKGLLPRGIHYLSTPIELPGTPLSFFHCLDF